MNKKNLLNKIGELILTEHHKGKNVPYLLYKFGLSNNISGLWAGSSMTYSVKQHRFYKRINKIIKGLGFVILLLSLLATLILASRINPDSFYYGFLQELLAELIFAFTLAYILWKILDREKPANISLLYNSIKVPGTDNIYEVSIFILNKSNRSIDSFGIYSAFHFPADYTQILFPTIDKLHVDAGYGNHIKVSYYFPYLIFCDQEVEIIKFNYEVDKEFHPEPSPVISIPYHIYTYGRRYPEVIKVRPRGEKLIDPHNMEVGYANAVIELGKYQTQAIF